MHISYVKRSNLLKRSYRSASRGFTLIEAALTMVIIGVGVMALLQLIAAGTMSNSTGTELTTAVNLANNIHEISIELSFKDTNNPTSTTTKESSVGSYDDVWDLNGDTYSPPLDVRRNPINVYANWSQKVTVQSVDPNNLTAVRPNSTTLSTAKVTVVVLHNNKAVYQASWLITAPSH